MKVWQDPEQSMVSLLGGIRMEGDSAWRQGVRTKCVVHCHCHSVVPCSIYELVNLCLKWQMSPIVFHHLLPIDPLHTHVYAHKFVVA